VDLSLNSAAMLSKKLPIIGMLNLDMRFLAEFLPTGRP